MWLLRRLAPDFKTIADFRRDNSVAIVGTCRTFVLFCRAQGLFTARLVALDRSKLRAAPSAKRVIGRREIAEEAGRLDRRIAEICPIWTTTMFRNLTKRRVRPRRRLQFSKLGEPNSIIWPPSST
jgi:hypothetical protein